MAIRHTTCALHIWPSRILPWTTSHTHKGDGPMPPMAPRRGLAGPTVPAYALLGALAYPAPSPALAGHPRASYQRMSWSYTTHNSITPRALTDTWHLVWCHVSQSPYMQCHIPPGRYRQDSGITVQSDSASRRPLAAPGNDCLLTGYPLPYPRFRLPLVGILTGLPF
jgi:hypothetical protein